MSLCMNALRSSLTAICLALVLALASVQVAAARGAPPEVGQMVLCTGSGAITVPVDATGAPTLRAHHCPDCVSVPFAALLADPTEPRVLEARAALDVPGCPVCADGQYLPVPKARGPPALI